jgi:simple sugar transport system permease protein
MSIPLIFAAVGGTFSVRAGVMALGLESMMMVGAFCSVLGSYYFDNAIMGLIAGMAGGALIGLFHAIFSIRYRMNQVISGIGLNLLATAATTLLMQLIWGNKGASPLVSSIDTNLTRVFSKIPILAGVLGPQSFSFIVLLFIVTLGWVLLFKTRFGLRLRMVGENPKAANSVGLRVHAMKYIGVLICGILAGYGGAYLAIDQLNLFVREMTAGRGYIAVVIAILGGYNPLKIVYCALLFGFSDALQIYLQSTGVAPQLIQMLPYLVTLMMLAFGVRHIRPPAGVGSHIED